MKFFKYFKPPYVTKNGFLRDNGKLSPATAFIYDNGLIVIEDKWGIEYEGQRESDVSYHVIGTKNYEKFLVAE
jgi:hypothetical protein